MAKEPICQTCDKRGKVVPATTVHHKIEHKGNWELFRDPDNLESVCTPCHSGPIQQAERIGYSINIGADGLPIDRNHPAWR